MDHEDSRSPLRTELRELGLTEVEQRLEISPLLAVGDAESGGLAERPSASCCCKIGDGPWEDDGDEDDEDGGG